jgi:hypothetical protein
MYLRLRYAGAGGHAEFVIDPPGRRVWAAWGGGAELEDVTAVLLGPVLGCVLRQRGTTCLHGSVVRAGGSAIVLLGAKGAGKSTTTLALLRAGATPVADDIAALAIGGPRPLVHAGQPHLRLHEAPAAALGGGFDDLRPMWSREEGASLKRYLDLPPNDEQEAVPLGAVYALAPRGPAGEAPSVRALAPADALPLLLAHRHVTFALDRGGQARDFAALAALAARVPVREVRRPEGLDSVPRVAELILADAGACAGAAPGEGIPAAAAGG